MAWDFEQEEENCRSSMLSMFVGKKIGSGASRRVYELKNEPNSVLKVEYTGKSFHNQTEWLIWQEIKDWPIADWFAKCIDIDGYGNTLIQVRTKPFECEKDFLAAVARTRGGVIPKVFADIHYGNFGLVDGVVACHDYGYHRFFEQIAREMSVEAGYIQIDMPCSEPDTFDVTDGGQFALDL